MRSVGVKPGEALTVIAACFGERPERALLTALEAHNSEVSLTFVERRVTLLGRARSLRPRIVMLPVEDARGVPSAPLIARLRVYDPNVRVMVVLTPGASRAGLADAIRAGGEALTVGSADDLLAALHDSLDPGPLSARELDASRSLLAAVQPGELRELLQFCVTDAHRALSADILTAERGVSSRETRALLWPAPSELIDWGRLLRVSLLQWRDSRDLPTLARASGFASVSALQHAAARRLHGLPNSASNLSPLLVSARLLRRVQQLSLEVERHTQLDAARQDAEARRI